MLKIKFFAEDFYGKFYRKYFSMFSPPTKVYPGLISVLERNRTNKIFVYQKNKDLLGWIIGIGQFNNSISKSKRWTVQCHNPVLKAWKLPEESPDLSAQLKGCKSWTLISVDMVGAIQMASLRRKGLSVKHILLPFVQQPTGQCWLYPGKSFSSGHYPGGLFLSGWVATDTSKFIPQYQKFLHSLTWTTRHNHKRYYFHLPDEEFETSRHFFFYGCKTGNQQMQYPITSLLPPQILYCLSGDG